MNAVLGGAWRPTSWGVGAAPGNDVRYAERVRQRRQPEGETFI